MGEARGGEGGERFHAGIDVRADEGTPVRAVRDGVVAAPMAAAEFGTLNESLRIGPVTYVHMRVGRVRKRCDAVLDEARFAAARLRRAGMLDPRPREARHALLARAKSSAPSTRSITST